MNWRIVYRNSKRRKEWHFKMIISKYSEFSMKSLFFFSVNCAKGTQYFHGKSRKFFCLLKNNALLNYFLTFQESYLWYRIDLQLWHIYNHPLMMFLQYIAPLFDKPYWIRRVRWHSYGTNCAWCNKIIVRREFLTIQ